MPDQPAPPPRAKLSRRQGQKREPLAVVCEVRQGIGPWRRLSLEDLSTGGFRITRFGQADPLQPVKIRIPGLQVLSASVCWQEGSAIGCAFAVPLHEAVFEHLVRGA